MNLYTIESQLLLARADMNILMVIFISTAPGNTKLQIVPKTCDYFRTEPYEIYEMVFHAILDHNFPRIKPAQIRALLNDDVA